MTNTENLGSEYDMEYGDYLKSQGDAPINDEEEPHNKQEKSAQSCLLPLSGPDHFVTFFAPSTLQKHKLYLIWHLVARERTKKCLSKCEFGVARHLISCAVSTDSLPSTLPPSLQSLLDKESEEKAIPETASLSPPLDIDIGMVRAQVRDGNDRISAEILIMQKMLNDHLVQTQALTEEVVQL